MCLNVFKHIQILEFMLLSVRSQLRFPVLCRVNPFCFSIQKMYSKTNERMRRINSHQSIMKINSKTLLNSL